MNLSQRRKLRYGFIGDSMLENINKMIMKVIILVNDGLMGLCKVSS